MPLYYQRQYQGPVYAQPNQPPMVNGVAMNGTKPITGYQPPEDLSRGRSPGIGRVNSFADYQSGNYQRGASLYASLDDLNSGRNAIGPWQAPKPPPMWTQDARPAAPQQPMQAIAQPPRSGPGAQSQLGRSPYGSMSPQLAGLASMVGGQPVTQEQRMAQLYQQSRLG